MLRIFPIAVLVLCPLTSLADEIILKNGQVIEWKTLIDKGDTLEAEDQSGAKTIVKKEEVSKIVTLSAKGGAAPLTGAAFTFDRKIKLSTVNLLATTNPKQDAIVGDWTVGGAGLIGSFSQGGHAKIQFDYAIPDEYDLTMMVERKDGKDDFIVGLVGGGGKQFTIHFDSWGANWAGIAMINGNGPNSSGLGVQQKIMNLGKERSLKFMIRRDGVVVQLDGKDFITWKADWNSISLHPTLVVPKKNALFVCFSGPAFFKVKMMTLTSPTGK